MYNSTLAEISRERGSKPGSVNKMQVRDQEKGSLAALKVGQRITGTVLSINQDVTVLIGKQEISVSKDILKNVTLGEKKTFEVISISRNEIELKLLAERTTELLKTFKATVVPAKKPEVMSNIKEKNAKKEAYNKQFLETRQKLEEIAVRLTDEDYQKLKVEGFLLEELPVEVIYTALNRIKQTLNTEAGAYAEEKAAGHQGVSASNREEEIIHALRSNNLPDTQENISRIMKALELSKSIGDMDDKAMKQLISQNLEPTIENIYKANYSSSIRERHAKKLSKEAWEELQGQVKDIITTAGYELNAENLASARWLLENELPLTPETLAKKKELDTVKQVSNQDYVLSRIMEGMKEGIQPKDANLGAPDVERLDKLISKLQDLKPETVTKAMEQDKELTIRNLISVQEARPAEKEPQIEKEQPLLAEDAVIDRQMEKAEGLHRYEEIKAQRQLEEIRLKMTLEAAARLEKKGFPIETKQLEEVVEALRELENSYYKQYFAEAQAEATEQAVHTLRETTQSIRELRQIPCYVLGSTLDLRKTQTISGLLSEGSKLKAELEKAGTAYETLMTVPNREYGDSIQKAFANMDSLLKELNIEATEENKRAARILAYNRMEIMQESIEQVKAYDMEVNTLMKNLHPAIAVRMIKEGINPLEQPIGDLNRMIEQMREEQGITAEEKFSTYLRRLEKNDQITQEERKAYIGIYRLLYNIEKSDGAALGTVINAGREVTLENLLSAVQTRHKGRMDAIIDDEFGALQEITRKGESIDSQLSYFRNLTDEEADREMEQEQAGVKAEYMEKVIKELSEEVSANKLMQVSHSIEQGMVYTVNGTSYLAPNPAMEGGVWNTLKGLTPEQLLAQLKAASSDTPEEDALDASKVQEIRELCKNSEQAIRFLNDFKVPSTPVNIMLANHLISNGESVIAKILKKNKNDAEKSENRLKELRELSDTIVDKQTMQEAYEKLETEAKEALQSACSTEKLDSMRLAELKSIGQQMTFLRTLAGREFYQIPIETEAGITNLNLTIIRGTEKSGRVTVSMESKTLGSVRAEFAIKEQVLKGFICCDNKAGLTAIRQNTTEIEQAAREKELSIKQMDFVIQGRAGDSYIYQNSEGEEAGSIVSRDTERTLYRIAKAIVNSVQRAERSMEQEKK